MTQQNLPELSEQDLTGRLREMSRRGYWPLLGDEAADEIERLRAAALSSQGAGEAVDGKWDGAEEWMSLAWELCADECGEEACTELVWECGPIPEPWGDRWLNYEDEAKRLIALVRKHTRPQAAQPSSEDVRELSKWLNEESTAPINRQALSRVLAAQPARVVESWSREACPLTQAIQRLNSNPYSLTKDECIEVLRALRAERSTPPTQADHSPDGGNMVEQQAGAVTELEDALIDALAGWKYIRSAHGDLYGVGWDRVQEKLEKQLAAFEAKKAGA